MRTLWCFQRRAWTETLCGLLYVRHGRFLHRGDFFPLGFERGDGFFVGGEQRAGLRDQLRRRFGGEAFVAELALQAGDVFRQFVDILVKPRQFGVQGGAALGGKARFNAGAIRRIGGGQVVNAGI